MFFNASRNAAIKLYASKAMARSSAYAIKEGQETSTNPVIYKSAILILIDEEDPTIYPGKQRNQSKSDLLDKIEKAKRAIQPFRDATPNGGSYLNEGDYFEPDWQNSFWGTNYARLLSIKKKYDPDGLFYCHHCVGSENWTKDGMCNNNSHSTDSLVNSNSGSE
jgi:hypothetical protein